MQRSHATAIRVPRITQPPFIFPNYALGTHSKLGGLGDALGPGSKSMASHGFEPVTIGTPVERAATRPPYPLRSIAYIVIKLMPF